MIEANSDPAFEASSNMKNAGITDLRKRLVKLIAGRARSGEDGAPMTAVARRVYDDLAVVLVPLVSQTGFDALVARAFQLAQREFPADPSPGGDRQDGEAFGQINLWLERQDERNTIDAAAAMFEALVALLTTLIGESLTTRYLRKAWPEDFSATGRSKGKRA